MSEAGAGGSRLAKKEAHYEDAAFGLKVCGLGFRP